MTTGCAAPGGSARETSAILLRSLSQAWSSSAWLRVNASLASTFTSDSPARDTEVTVFTSCICCAAPSIRSVISSATCAGDAPGYAVTTTAWRITNSGSS